MTPPGLVPDEFAAPPLALDDKSLYIRTRDNTAALYTYDGSNLVKLVSEKADAAHCGSLSGMFYYSADAGAVIFVGGIKPNCNSLAEDVGIFLLRGNTLTLALDIVTTPVPGAPGTTWDLGYSMALSGTNFAFANFIPPTAAGIYASIGGQLGVTVNNGTPIPGGKTNFAATSFAFVAIDGTNVAFNAIPKAGTGATEGIYTTLGGSLRKVIDTNDTLEGKKISHLQMSNRSFSDDEIAFVADFGSSAGVYVARLVAEPVPAPRLTVAVNADSVALSWPLEGQDYGLYETGDFPPRSPAQWTFLPYQKVVDGRITVTRPLGAARAFYRLMKP